MSFVYTGANTAEAFREAVITELAELEKRLRTHAKTLNTKREQSRIEQRAEGVRIAITRLRETVIDPTAKKQPPSRGPRALPATLAAAQRDRGAASRASAKLKRDAGQE